MSVGHVARVLEAEGIPTTSIYVRSFAHVVDEMKLARAVITRHPMGRPLGAPGDWERHRSVVAAALDLLDVPGGKVVELPEPYRAGGF